MKANRVLCFWLLCGLAAAAQAQGRKMQDQPDDGQWPMPAKNYASTRFSTLTDINTQTVRNLKLVAKGVVIVGNSGGEFGVRGWMARLGAKDGKNFSVKSKSSLAAARRRFRA
jgi:glucose dehydrogenase